MKIPADVLAILESETDGLHFGEVTLTVHLRDGSPRYTIGRQRSIIPDTLITGVGGIFPAIEENKNIGVSGNGMRKAGRNA